MVVPERSFWRRYAPFLLVAPVCLIALGVTLSEAYRSQSPKKSTTTQTVRPQRRATYREAAKGAWNVQQSYVANLKERLEGDSNKYIQLIDRFELVSKIYVGDISYGSGSDWELPVCATREVTKSDGSLDVVVELTPALFDPANTQCEGDLFSILDNESVHAAQKKRGVVALDLHYPESAKKAIRSICARPPQGAKVLLAELQSDYHQLALIKAGERRVTPVIMRKIQEHFAIISSRMLLETKERHDEIETLLQYMNFDHVLESDVKPVYLSGMD